VIYTSGSTGQPKGVEIMHKGLSNLIAWHHDAFRVTSFDRATQMASPGFDAAVWEVWPYLTAGASLYFPDESVRSQPDLLRNWLVEKQITISFVPTPVAERMLDLEWPTNAALRFLLTGADTLHHYPPAGLPFQLVNNYGPTESTVVATSGTVASSASSELPSVGCPITNTQIYLLDSQMQQVPPGSAGDLYIGGLGLARGYRNRPDLTAERFVTNPFSEAPDDRLYKTGDLARMLPDGQIAFIGRIDDQVKIRGFRVELSEITNALSRHPAIRETVVSAREDNPGQKRLVSYVVLRPGIAVTNAGLRDFLSHDLPDYMMPAAFVTMDSLPLGPNGKVNRSELPSPADGNILRDENFISPRNATEEQIAAIIAELLGLERVGVNDNFFLLGGNSLLATQVIARVRVSFDVEVTLLNVFDNPTVAGIAAVVEQSVIEQVEALSEEEAGRLVTE
jgi:acyl-coenzyme A synthetase/AMP-(fatty) acid ligase/acyl carrier protein